jgi:hypothetical protein
MVLLEAQTSIGRSFYDLSQHQPPLSAQRTNSMVAHTCFMLFWVQQEPRGNMKHSALEELLCLEGARVETANLKIFSSCSSSLRIHPKEMVHSHLFV